MALSDYLTGDEWDACFYASFGKSMAPNFGDSMRQTIQTLLAKGYEFAGLDENGNKYEQVEDGINAPKVCIFLGNPYNCNIEEIMNNGRNFLKEHAPELVSEPDEVWESALQQVRRVDQCSESAEQPSSATPSKEDSASSKA
jgi:hypothetical protein